MEKLPITEVSQNGMVVAPHYAASQAGLAILKSGGNAIEAAIATAASLSVHYPHMTGIGGDAFWLIYDPTEGVSFIEASGYSGFDVSPDQYKTLESIPFRGKFRITSYNVCYTKLLR